MRVFFPVFAFFLSLNSYNGYSQVNFDKEQSIADPLKKGDIISTKEKIALHQDYLKKAVETKNIQQQFYGHLYLWSDYLAENNYEGATIQLFSADSIAQQSGNLSWQGAVHNKRGILDFELNDAESALKNFILTLDYCRKAKDSACVAANLKEVALCYQRLQKYDSAKHYFQLAIPLIRKYTDSFKLYAYYSNYSNLLKDMGDYPGAKRYLDSSMIFIMKGKDLFMQSVTKNNLAAFYVNTGEYEKAFKILEECIAINKLQGWHEQLSFNYANMSSAFSKQGNYRAAYKYLENYHFINDSLKGVEVLLKIADLNTSYKTQEKELIIKQSQLDLAIAKQTIQKRTWLIILSLIAIGLGIWRWLAQMNAVKKKKIQSQQNLTELTRILLDKNTALSALEEKLLKHEQNIKLNKNASTEEIKSEPDLPTDKDDFEKNIYNQRILTPADWSAFKIYFEKAYPGYLLRLRNAYPALTEAEERMFLFIKLKLTNKEAAAILGISADSVKKTRTRLRKRLGLDEKVDIEEYVRQF